VLLVEDNEINQLIAVELLRAVGGQVVVAQNGLEALEELARTPSPFHVVLMDLAMPVMDGWEATRRIRSESRWHDLPILAMTAHAFAEERDRCLAAGMQDHLTKPIDPDRLYQALTAYKPESSAPSPAAAPAAAAPAPAPAPPGPSLDPPSAVNPGAKPLDRLREAGVDVAGALRRTAGDESLYLKLLNSFATTQRTAVEQVEQALASGDHATAERLVHTIKGVAGNLGAMVLHSSADALEHALRESAPTETVQQTFNQCLTSTLQLLDAALHQPELARSGETDQASPAEAGPDQGLADTHKDLLNTLASLIDCGDGEAIELAAREQTLLQRILGDQVYAQLHSQLDDLEFEAALTTLQPALGGPP
jgi:two-component system sensor histidine kinase/response regulator